MGIVKEPVAAKLICGVLAVPGEGVEQAEREMVEAVGPIDARTEFVPFVDTDYYTREMGPELQRAWWSFHDLIPQGELARIKLRTNEIESRLADSTGHRRVNLDPGYILTSRLVLATTKDYAHRIYLGEGIYAEVTLIHRDGQYHPLDWTYPDCRRPENIGFFEKVRLTYKNQLRAGAVTDAR